MNCFLLLNLPYVTFIEVLKSLDPVELYLFTHCSQKTRYLADSAFTKKIQFETDFQRRSITFSGSYSMYVATENDIKKATSNKIPLMHIRPGVKGYYVTYVGGARHFEIIFDEKNNGMEKLVFEIMDLFKCPLVSFCSDYVFTKDNLKPFFMEIQERQKQPLSNLTIASSGKNDIEWVLNNVKVTKMIETCFFLEDDFSFQPQCEHMSCAYGHWVNLNHLLSFKACSIIEVDGAELKHWEVTGFLEAWKAGELPNLEYLKIIWNDPEDEGPILGFSKEELLIEACVNRIKKRNYKYIGHCKGGVEIKSINGVEANLQRTNDAFAVVVEFFVWK